MEKKTKTEIRKVRIIHLLLSGDHLTKEPINYDLTQKRLVKCVLMSEKAYRRGTEEEISLSDSEMEKKINILVSKVLLSLEEDEIIVRIPKKFPGKRGPAQYVVTLNDTPKSLYKILEILNNYNGIYGNLYKPAFVSSLFYQDLISHELLDKLFSLLKFKLTDEEKKSVYYMVKTSSGALYSLFYEAYDREKDPCVFYVPESAKEVFLKNIELEFITDIFNNYGIKDKDTKNHYVEIEFTAKIHLSSNEETNEFYEFSDNSKNFKEGYRFSEREPGFSFL